MSKVILSSILLALGSGLAVMTPGLTHGVSGSLQVADEGFNAHVVHPAYVRRHPKVLFDEAHHNRDTAAGRFKPFVDLISSDGYEITPNRSAFSKTSFKSFSVLVIVNAVAPEGRSDPSAFTNEECDAVRDWVREGGAVLLITGHAPFGSAAAALAERFDVDVTKGFTIDSVHYDKESSDQTELVFNRDDGLLGDHPITRGRNTTERISRVMTFSGTSLKGPKGSVAFLKLADTAMDVLPPNRKQTSPEDAPPDHTQVSAAGRAQGLALEFGKGRVVILSESSMLTAQVGSRGFRFGMNISGIDNRQLALNIMHWISGLLK